MEIEHHQLDLRYTELRRKDARRERHLLSSLAEHGQQVPVVVVAAAEENRYILVDGYKRVRAIKKLRRDTVTALVWELPSADALVLERMMRSGEPDSPLEQGWLLSALKDEHGLSLDELARRFDRSKSWVSRRLGLAAGLPAAVQEAVRLGRIGPHAAMRYMVPLARANGEDCLRLTAAIAEPLSSRQVATLYAGYKAGDMEAKERLIDDPLLYLRAQEAARREADEAELPPDKLLLRDLDIIAAIARRLKRHLQQGLARHLGATQRAEVLSAMSQARHDTTNFFTRCEQELRHAGSSDTNEHPTAQAEGTR
jgi:ParB family transcriptional regulator, chromosome partitioning protein